MRKAHFRVFGRMERVRPEMATVTIEYLSPELSVLRVRPLRRKRTFDLNLADVARSVVFDVTRKELADKRRAKRAKKVSN